MRTLNCFSKLKVTIAVLFLSVAALAQNFLPLNAAVTKRFYNSANPADNDYFFYADSIHQPTPGVTVFYQYFTLVARAGTVDVSACAFWSPAAMFVADTTWLGAEVRYDNTAKQLLLVNAAGDTLDFDFSIPQGDSAKFFENSAGSYFIKAGQTTNETIYSVTDAVKTFTILRLDANSLPVNTGLHGKEIKIGQQTGLIRFFDAYHFPAKQTHLALQGQLNPLIGTYQMRFEDVYPFQPGDSLQYAGSSGPAPCTYIRGYRVMTRNETADSVTIVFRKSAFHTSTVVPQPSCPAQLDVYPDTLRFPKNSDLIGYPYNRLDGLTHPLTVNLDFGKGYETRTEDSTTTYCGKRHSYVGKAQPFRYCSDCHCIGNVDAANLVLPELRYVMGLGTTQKQLSELKTNPVTRTLNQTYSSIGGIVCGTYTAVGLLKNELKGISVFPSPANDQLTISAQVDQLTIFSSDGRIVQTILHPAASIDIAHFPPGLYILQIQKGDNMTNVRIIKN